jgi:hypothetical protein
MAGFQTERYVMKELAVLVFVRVEEEPEVVEYVIEQVVHHDASFNISGQSIDEFVVFAYFL